MRWGSSPSFTRIQENVQDFVIIVQAWACFPQVIPYHGMVSEWKTIFSPMRDILTEDMFLNLKLSHRNKNQEWVDQSTH